MKSSGKKHTVWHWWWKKEHPQPTVKHPPPVPPPPPLPKASWPLENGPWVFTAWDATAARKGPWQVLKIIQPGEAPVWSYDLSDAVAQAESLDQQATALKWLASPASRKAVVATQGGWEPSAPFLAAGVNTCFAEAYQNEDPSHTPARMVWQAKHDGWPYVIPVVGCYHGYPLSNYDLTPYGKNFAVWLAEEMGQDDWDTLARLAA